MPPEAPKPTGHEIQEQQERSIKSRKFQLFDDPGESAGTATRPFAEYLREAKPLPMAPGVKAAFWAAGVVLVLLFLAALLGGRGSRAGRRVGSLGMVPWIVTEKTSPPRSAPGWPGDRYPC